MKIISWNVNGIRAVYKKGFEESIKKMNPDIFCLQEIRCSVEDLEKLPVLDGYYVTYNHAIKKGYSGVAIYSKEKPKHIEPIELLPQFMAEGRSLLAQFDGFCFLALYIPNGGRKKENLVYKLEVYKELLKYLEKNKDMHIIVAGDFNIAHTEIDLARPKENANGIMFTPEEREQITKMISLGYLDSFRMLHPEEVKYSWWANWANAREKNIGWRIDYVFIPETLEKRMTNAFILNNVFGSDHCPVGIEIT